MPNKRNTRATARQNGGAGFGSATDTQRVDSTLIKPLEIPVMET